MTKQISFAIFGGLAALCFGVLIYHIIGVIHPFDKTPAWRHAIFVGVCSISVDGVLKRPEWFTWFIAILTIQQWYSHGSYAIELWQKQHTIHWVSVGVIIFLPVIFILLLLNGRSKNEDRANQQHS